MRHFLLLVVLLFTTQASHAQMSSRPSVLTPGRHVTLFELSSRLSAEIPARGLSEATPRELQLLLPSDGGLLANLWNPQYVTRIGSSTFLIDLRLVTLVLGYSACIVLLFFTPLGFALFRGHLHGLAGRFLLVTSIAPELGRHLMREPRKWLSRTGSARAGFSAYMREDFIPLYRNNVTALAFLGTAFLILVIGLRGIKFLVAHQPDLIIIAIIVELTVLCLLGMTTWYERARVDEGFAQAPVPAAGDLEFSDVRDRLLSLIQEWEQRHNDAAEALDARLHPHSSGGA